MTDQLPDSDLSTADLVDRYGHALASIPVQFRSFGRKSRFAGPAVTVKCFVVVPTAAVAGTRIVTVRLPSKEVHCVVSLLMV